MSYRDVAQEVLQRDLFEIPCPKVLPRDLLKRSVQRDLVQLLYTDLAWRPLLEILCRDLVKRAEFFLGDHVCIA